MSELELPLVNYEQALGLKEIGFPQSKYSKLEKYITSNTYTYHEDDYSSPSESVYISNTKACRENVIGKLRSSINKVSDCNFEMVEAPSLELVKNWLQKEKNIQIIITTRDKGWWYFQLMQNWNFEDMESGYEEDSSDEALSKAINRAIEILKK